MGRFEVLRKIFLKDASTWDLPSVKKVLLELLRYHQHPFNIFIKQNGIIFAPSTQITGPKGETYTEQSIMIGAFLSYKVCTWKNTYGFRKAHFIFTLRNMRSI